MQFASGSGRRARKSGPFLDPGLMLLFVSDGLRTSYIEMYVCNVLIFLYLFFFSFFFLNLSMS